MGSVSEPLLFQEPTIVKISEDERISGNMAIEHIAEAVVALHRDGFVVLENVVDQEHCDVLDKLMCEEAGHMAKDPKTIRTIAILGPNPRCNFADGNTALGAGYGGRQGVHADMAYNFPQMPCTITANYYLKDASLANGSTELWLGSSRDTNFRDHKACRELGPGDDPYMPKKISLHTEDDNYAMEANFGVREECLQARRRFAPPVQPSVKGGSVMLRDLRLWHAGIANFSDKTRIMLNVIHTPGWYECPTSVNLPGNARPLVNAWAKRENPMVFAARYLADEAECRAQQFRVDFSSRNKGYWGSLDNTLAAGFAFIDA
ncbi:hypothetical protein LTR17_005106 [Elasticomyces elasticus]|nr:hypothetical protein LTR17_005106 [Elasticomyces elasticus]